MEKYCNYCNEEIIKHGNDDTCKRCFDINENYKKMKRQKYIQKRRDNGLCLNCGKTNDTDLVHCSKCKIIILERNKAWYEKNKEHAKQKQREYYQRNKKFLNRKRKEYNWRKKAEVQNED